MNNFNIDYDNKFDILYISIEDCKHYADDSLDDIYLYRTYDNDKIVGGMIPNASKFLTKNILNMK